MAHTVGLVGVGQNETEEYGAMSVVLDGSTQWLEIADAIIDDGAGGPDYPFSFAAWGKVESGDTGAQMNLLSSGDSGGSNDEVAISVHDDDTVAAYQRRGSTQLAFSSTTYSADTWFLVVGLFVADNDFTVYLDGGNSGNQNVARLPESLDFSTIGTRARSSTPDNSFNGKIAEVAMWDKELSSSEISDLWNSGAGEPPENVASGNLLFHRQLLSDSSTGTGFTVSEEGSPTFDSGDHPFSRAATGFMTTNKGYWGP